MAPPGVRVNVTSALLTPGEDRFHMKCVFHQEVTKDSVAHGTKCLHSWGHRKQQAYGTDC